MDVAEIDVGQDIFENGQTYVALSRVKSLSGLYLSGYNSNKIFIHTKAREFYEKLRMRNRTTLAADSLKTTDDSLKTTDDSLKIPSKPNSHPQENTCFLSKWKAGNLDTSKKTLDSSKKTLDTSLKTINDTVKPTDDTVKTLHMSRNIRSFFGTTVKTS